MKPRVRSCLLTSEIIWRSGEFRSLRRIDTIFLRPRTGRFIEGFSSKDDAYTDYFFFVALEDAVLEDLVGKVLTKWGILGSLDIPWIDLSVPEVITIIYADIILLICFRRSPDQVSRTVSWRSHFLSSRAIGAQVSLDEALLPRSSQKSAQAIWLHFLSIQLRIRRSPNAIFRRYADF